MVNGLSQRSKDIVIYDGECNFCVRQINHLRRLDRSQKLDFVSLHDPMIAAQFPELTFEMLMEQMWVVTKSGGKYGGADAVRYLSTQLPILYPLIPILYFPLAMPLWRFLYKKIAQSRYRIAGRSCENGTCSLHYPTKASTKA